MHVSRLRAVGAFAPWLNRLLHCMHRISAVVPPRLHITQVVTARDPLIFESLKAEKRAGALHVIIAIALTLPERVVRRGRLERRLAPQRQGRTARGPTAERGIPRQLVWAGGV